MRRYFKYLILGIGIGLIVASLFQGMGGKTDKIDMADDFINPESIVNNSIGGDNNKSVEPKGQLDGNGPEEAFGYVDFSIPSGVGSHKVADLLLELGLIDDVKDFEDRIAELKLDKRIRAGEYRVEKGSDLDRIIGIITGKKDM